MEAYVAGKVDVAQRLRAINSKIEDKLPAGLIPMKLPEEFTPLIQSITHVGDITTEFVEERLLSEAAHLESQKKDSALARTRTRRKFSPEKGSRNVEKGSG